MIECDFKKAARAEQLWYSATIIGLNAFVASQHLAASAAGRIAIMGVSFGLSLYAVALIVNRARKYNEDGYRKPAFVDFFDNLKLVCREAEGALFYVLLVVASFLAVAATNAAATPMQHAIELSAGWH
jgi:hypothetical protein